MVENTNTPSSAPNFAAQIAALTAQVQENANKLLALEDENVTLHCGDYATPRAAIPGASHQHAITGDSRTRELLTACKRATSDSVLQSTAIHFRRPVPTHQLSSRHCSPPRCVGRDQCPPLCTSSEFAACKRATSDPRSQPAAYF